MVMMTPSRMPALAKDCHSLVPVSVVFSWNGVYTLSAHKAPHTLSKQYATKPHTVKATQRGTFCQGTIKPCTLSSQHTAIR